MLLKPEKIVSLIAHNDWDVTEPSQQSTGLIRDAQFSNPNAHHLSHEQAAAREDAIAAFKSYSLFLNLH